MTKQILGIVFASALAATGAHAAGGEKQQESQPGQQGQLQQEPGAQQAAQERTVQGEVTSIQEDQLTLDVAGEQMTIQGEPNQFEGVEQGQQVQVTIVPQLEAASVKQLGDPQAKELVGTAEEIQENVLTLRDSQGQQHQVKVKQSDVKDIEQGQEVLIELEKAPAEASQSDQYRAVDVQPTEIPAPEAQPGMQPQPDLEQQPQQPAPQ